MSVLTEPILGDRAKLSPGRRVQDLQLFDSLADFVQAVFKADERIDEVARIQNAMSERVPADGGFVVPEEFQTALIEASLEGSIIRPEAQVFPMKSLRMNIPAMDETTHAGSLYGGWTASWTEEAVSITDTTPQAQRDTLEAKKLAAFTTVDNELMNDTEALEVFLRQTLPPAVRWYEEDAFINGSGQGEPHGVVTATCAVNVTRTNAGQALVHADVVNLIKRLWAQGWTHARWLCGSDVLGILVDVYQAVGSVTTQGMPNNPQLWYDLDHKCWRLFGVPLTVTEHTPASTNVGDLVLADPSAYVIGDREVMTIQVSPHPKFNFDQSVIKVRHRVDGRTWPNTPITPASGAATTSPVVVLN